MALHNIFSYFMPSSQSHEDDGTVAVPQPPTIPLLGNLDTFDRNVPINSFVLLWKTYGEIYQVDIGRRLIVVNTYKLQAEVHDEKRFHKIVAGPLAELRDHLTGDGLFTAQTGEKNWGLAHRILMPAFGPIALKGMFNDMYDICSQLVLKWERFGPNYVIDPTDDFTRLALDTVGLCTFHYRLNSFYTEAAPPFAKAMVGALKEAQLRAARPKLVRDVFLSSNVEFAANGKIMDDIVDNLVHERQSHSETKYNDLMDLMLEGKDPQTGEKLPIDRVRMNLVTFMIAGHETTSGMLSFVVYYALKHPHVYARLQSEVDSVLAGEPIRVEHLNKLPYVTAVMRETLRLSPTAPTHSVTPYEYTIIGGKYQIPKNTTIAVNTYCTHRDPAVWGEDAEDFKPERMLDGKFEALPPKAWAPFGNGMRACIGRSFFWQEAIIAIATIFQRFELRMADPSYTLRLRQTLTIKPEGFYFHATPRKGLPSLITTKRMEEVEVEEVKVQPLVDDKETKPTIHVLYGSNTGSSEAFAQRVASAATGKGFRASIATLDSVVPQLPKSEPVVIITASFEGEPADNAGHFVECISNIEDTKAFEGVKYTVFGCGNKDWAATYQKIPKLIDGTLEAKGAQRIFELGAGDAGGDSFFESFDQWENGLWKVLSEEYGISSKNAPIDVLNVKIEGSGTERAVALRQADTSLGKVTENRLLTKGGPNQKRHIEFELPSGMNYEAGDYLAILPTNPPASVRRVLTYFGLSAETTITITSIGPSTLPTGKPVSLRDVLSGYVELNQPATQRNLEAILSFANEAEKTTIQSLIDGYKEIVHVKRLSVLDTLVANPSIKVPLNVFLTMLPAMRVRQYSISSSSLWNPSRVTLTVSVVSAPALSGSGETFQGVASNYLACLQPGDLVQLSVRASAAAFSLPTSPSVPLILFCAGSGLAPMRGFIQERAVQVKAGRTDVGKVLLFFGCRDPEKDYLYSDSDLKEWAELGVVDIRPAFSKAKEKSEGCAYVQDRILHNGEDVKALYRQGAKIFTCGGTAVANGVKDACIKLYEEVIGSYDAAVEAFAKVQKERYATDIFG